MLLELVSRTLADMMKWPGM